MNLKLPLNVTMHATGTTAWICTALAGAIVTTIKPDAFIAVQSVEHA